jgi:hypothetical protein
MRVRQRGVTMIGWIILLTPFAIVGYAGMRLAPLYLNYMKVVRALDEVAGNGSDTNPQAIRTTIDRHFEIDMVDYPTSKDMKITREGLGWTVEAAYDAEAPLFANISLHVAFDKTVHTKSGGP